MDVLPNRGTRTTAHVSRDAMVAALVKSKAIQTDGIAKASSCIMLEQAQIRPGMRVLEIGSGGYNAALIAHLVGETGEVTTVDQDPDVVDRARRCLASAGYDTVNVVLADGEAGVPAHAPYDRIIVTAAASDIPPAWCEQLTETGRVVVPLRIHGLTHAVVFERCAGRLVSRGYELCSFPPMQGRSGPCERIIQLDGDDIVLQVDGEQHVDGGFLREALSHPRVERWSGVKACGPPAFGGLHLWLAMRVQHLGILRAHKSTAIPEDVADAWPLGTPTLVDGPRFAYLGLRPLTPDRSTCEIGVYGHGPGAEQLVHRMTRDIQAWNGACNARIEAYPADAPDDELPKGALILDRRHTRIAVSWPGAPARMTPARKPSARDTGGTDALRARMVDELRELGAIRSERVASAVRTVPRHLFAPGEPLQVVYSPTRAIVTKRNEHGAATSLLSESHIQSTMLEQAEIEPGMRVLEIGTGGYNAALIAELVGETGKVVSIDIDPEIVEMARGCLTAAGYQPQVELVLGDAEHGAPEQAPYDRIVVTAGAWDIPPAWTDQLTASGRIVVPLRMRGLTRSVALERRGDHLCSRNYRLCGFVPIQGLGAHSERLVALDGKRVGLLTDDDQPIDAEALRAALFGPRVVHASSMEFGAGEPLHDLDLWIATAADRFALLKASPEAIDSGLVSRSTRVGGKAILTDRGFAYRASARPVDAERTRYIFDAYAHGPEAEDLADHLAGLIEVWDREHRGGPGACIEVHPSAVADTHLPAGRIINKRHTKVVISWP